MSHTRPYLPRRLSLLALGLLALPVLTQRFLHRSGY